VRQQFSTGALNQSVHSLVNEKIQFIMRQSFIKFVCSSMPRAMMAKHWYAKKTAGYAKFCFNETNN
jgi:hypothetical protein